MLSKFRKNFKIFTTKKINGLFIEKFKHVNGRRTLESDLSRNAENRRDKIVIKKKINRLREELAKKERQDREEKERQEQQKQNKINEQKQ